jgi:hypothetical protein
MVMHATYSDLGFGQIALHIAKVLPSSDASLASYEVADRYLPELVTGFRCMQKAPDDGPGLDDTRCLLETIDTPPLL